MLAARADAKSTDDSRTTGMKVFENVTIGADHRRRRFGRVMSPLR